MRQLLYITGSVLLITLLAGCGTMRPIADTGLAFGAAWDPDRADQLNAVRRLLQSPVESDDLQGYAFERIWYYEGMRVPAESITWEDRYVRRSHATRVTPPSSGKGEAIPDTVSPDIPDDIREKLESIVNGMERITYE